MTTQPQNHSGRGECVARVCLIGAGPGDAGLITSRGLTLLRGAEVVVHDALILPSLLGEARTDAQLIDVGKRHAHHKMSQDEINTLLLELARQGRFVVRLKGGDPFVFGRGAEEAVFLGKHGISCEIVPGVTAAIAACAMAGIPVTHRHFASSVTFITGHEDPAKNGDAIDFAALAALLKTGGTLCVYMGMNRLSGIVEALLQHGVGRDMLAAAIEWGATPRQRTVKVALESLAAAVASARLGAPSIIVIGRAVGIDEPGLDAFVARPLFGRRIVITRTRAQASDLRVKLEELGAEVLEAPTIEILPATAEVLAMIDETLRGVKRFDWLVLTSANGVEAMADRVEKLGLDGRSFAGVKIAAIGDATAAALWSRLRLRADLIPAQFVAESLATDLIGDGAKGKRFLLLRADIARAALPELLVKGGGIVEEYAIYRTVPAAGLPAAVLQALRAGNADWITFTSSSTVKNMLALLGDDRELLRGVKLASIGPITSQTLRENGLSPSVEAQLSSIDGLVAAIM